MTDTCQNPNPDGGVQAGALGIPPSLEHLRERILTPREIVRDADGHLMHPALPALDERVRYDDFLAAFGIEVKCVSMEFDVSADVMEAYYDAGVADCSHWTPTVPLGEGWLLLEIYDTEDGPHAMFGRAMSEEAWPRYNGPHFDMRAHLVRQIAFSHRTFGPGHRTQGVIDHIKKELVEIEKSPGDVEEWIDVAILALDGAQRAMLGHFRGGRPLPRLDVSLAVDKIVRTLRDKQAKNEKRQWPDWQTADPNKAIEHARELDR